MGDCVFCKIAGKEFDTDFLFEDQHAVAFRDLNPQAPVHVLIIPKEHHNSVREVEDESLLGHLIAVGTKVAANLGLDDYRFVINRGKEAGQTVFHLHVHLLGGRKMNWPPG